ncbi:MAG TPA: hypothetical protein VIV60_13585 [Polyangiaceae bacterium]
MVNKSLHGNVGERGTAIFIVVMVVTLLTGIGLFAARVTGSVDAAMGYARQSAQTRALAVYAAQLAPSLLSALSYRAIAEMDATVATGTITPCPTNGTSPNQRCLIRNHQALATSFGIELITQQAETVPGSLGPSTGLTSVPGVDGNLRIEVFERYRLGVLPGFDFGGNSRGMGTFDEYGVTAWAQVRPIITAPNPAWCGTVAESSTATVQAVRVNVIAPHPIAAF